MLALKEVEFATKTCEVQKLEKTRKCTNQNQNRPVYYLKAGTRTHTEPRNAEPGSRPGPGPGPGPEPDPYLKAVTETTQNQEVLDLKLARRQGPDL